MNQTTPIDRNPERVFLDAMGLRAGEPAWLASLRNEGKALFAARGLPSRRVEAWKYSDLHRIVADADLSRAGEAAASVVSIPDALVVPIRAGHVGAVPDDLPKGLTLASLREAITRDATLAQSLGRINPQSDHAVAALNMALWDDGLVLRVEAGRRIAQPVHLAFDWTGGADRDGRHVRLLVLLGTGAELTLVESHVGAASAVPLTTLVSEVRLDAAAHLTHLRLERLGTAMRQSTVLLAEIAAEARLDGASVSEGAAFARRETRVRLAGRGAAADLSGVQLLGAGRLSDDTLVIDHAAPHGTSRQAFRGVVGEGARGVVQGRISVGVGAVGTDARQGIKGLLLSRRAEMDAKPELEILADDVSCAHGTAIGELDAAALFYLRARGIPEDEARALLIEGFLSVAFESVSNETVKSLAEAAVAAWVARERGSRHDD